MKLAVCSDIHDNLAAVDQMLDEISGAADALCFCGDFCAPFTLKALAEGFEGPIHVVWGNNDGDQWLLTEIAHQFEHVHLHGVFAELDWENFHVAVVHYPKLGRALARSDYYDVVCYGHDHTAHHVKVGETLLVNPGELMGRLGRSTYALVDLTTREVTITEVLAS